MLEDARLVLPGNARPGVGHADGKVAVTGLGAHAHLAGVGELDGIPNQVEEDLGQALLVTHADRQGLGDLGFEGKLLVLS
jgi:hypothetical protein